MMELRLDGLRSGATHHCMDRRLFVELGEHAAAMHDERAAPHSAVGRQHREWFVRRWKCEYPKAEKDI